MTQRSSLLLFLLAVVFLLLASAPAQAQCRPGLLILYSGDQEFDQHLNYKQQSPTYGFTTYACPSPPEFFNFQLWKMWFWTEVCPSGGIFLAFISHTGDAQMPAQINVDSYVQGPLGTPAINTGFAYAPGSDPPGAVWQQTGLSNGTCY